MTDEKPEMIYVAGRHVYKANDVFSQNYDGVLLAKDAWECTQYRRVTPPEVYSKDVQFSRIEAFWKDVETGMCLIEVAARNHLRDVEVKFMYEVSKQYLKERG